ncbi:MAG: nucleotidyltransferase [Bacteroidetes bacterium]|nr:MAG: nucleotidyltransferase [Bacteroidota bacterium]
MKTLQEIKEKLGTVKSKLKQDYKVVSLELFGSYARNEQTENSDLDILVSFDENNYPGYLEFVKLENYLSQLVNLKIDLVPKDSIKPFLRKYILNEAVPI